MSQEQAIGLGVTLGVTVGLFLWAGLIVWTYRDIRDRSRDLAMQVLSVFLVMAFNLFGLLLYLILRPRETLDEAYARSLEEEALLREIGEESTCPSCRRFAEKDFLFCPYCQTQLREPCTRCGRPLSLSWSACPACGTGRRLPQPAAARPQPTQVAAREAEATTAPQEVAEVASGTLGMVSETAPARRRRSRTGAAPTDDTEAEATTAPGRAAEMPDYQP